MCSGVSPPAFNPRGTPCPDPSPVTAGHVGSADTTPAQGWDHPHPHSSFFGRQTPFVQQNEL